MTTVPPGTRATLRRPRRGWPTWTAIAVVRFGADGDSVTVIRVEGRRALVVADGLAEDAGDPDDDGMPYIIGWWVPVSALAPLATP